MTMGRNLLQQIPETECVEIEEFILDGNLLYVFEHQEKFHLSDEHLNDLVDQFIDNPRANPEVR